jgi:transposase
MEGALTAAGSGKQVPASDYRALQSQVRELQRLFGKKTPEGEILKGSLEHATGQKTATAAAVAAEGRFAGLWLDGHRRRHAEPDRLPGSP